MKYVDLHTHTCVSDGTDSPAELIKKASALGLCAVAITDHDSIAGLAEAEAQGEESGVEVIRGCELSVESERGEVHILGFWIGQKAQKLEDALLFLREERLKRNTIIIEKLQNMAIDISLEDMATVVRGETIGRPHIALLLMQKGYSSSVREAFVKYLGAHGKAYVPRKLLCVEDAIGILTDAGATVCLAHPGLIPCDEAWLDNYIKYLCEHGLGAIEAHHSEHPPAMRKKCLALAAKYSLGVSGGSDYHGHIKPHIHLGFGKGDLRVPVNILRKLKAQRH